MPLFNPRNEQERQREAMLQESARMAQERRLIPKLRREFKRVAKAASAGFSADGKLGALIAISSHKQKIESLLAESYVLTIRRNSERVINESQKISSESLEKKDVEGDIQRLITTWITTNALSESLIIFGTTKDLIIKIIEDNENENETVISKKITESVGGSLGLARSRMIARTETHDAAQSAILDTVGKLNFPPQKKEWVAVEDSRTRDTHRRADGQKVDLDDSFQVGSSRMKRPSDRSAPADEVINCRCVMVFSNNDN